MKKRKNIIISVVTCMVSICLMMFGVYAATNPSVSINGQVSYTVTDAKLLVQGKLTGAKGVENGTYPEAASTYTSSTRVVDKNNQYLDFTTGGSTGNASDNLAPWSFGDLEFEEITGGYTNPISASLKMTNYSSYNVKATITMANSLENVTRTVNKAGKELAETSTRVYTLILPAYTTSEKSVEVSVVYNVTDASKSVPQQNVNFEVKFEWTNEQPTPTVSVDDIIASNGIVTMGRSQVWTQYEEDYEWNVDNDGFVLNLDGTKMQTDDGDNIKLVGYDNDGMWTFVTTSGVSLGLGYDYDVQLSTFVLASDSNTAVITGGLDMRIYMPTKDVKWIAFAYKDANGELKKIQYNCDWSDNGHERINETLTSESAENIKEATSVYFAVYWYVPLSFYGQVYLETDKITKTTEDNSYGYTTVTKCVHNGTNAPSSVMAGDYYYSDIRQRIRNADSDLIQSLNIDSNNSIFKNIQTRTINDLYKNNIIDNSSNWWSGTATYSDQALPIGADGAQEDMFWVLSVNETFMCKYGIFSYPSGIESQNTSSWTRTMDPSSGSVRAYDNYHGGQLTGDLPDYMTGQYKTGGSSVSVSNGYGPRIGFELTLG